MQCRETRCVRTGREKACVDRSLVLVAGQLVEKLLPGWGGEREREILAVVDIDGCRKKGWVRDNNKSIFTCIKTCMNVCSQWQCMSFMTRETTKTH